MTEQRLVSLMTLTLGAVVGSFLNVLIHRLPREESIVFPGSHCQACNTAINWHDNIPVLSFLLLRGRCRSCGQRISWQYPLVEVTMALLSLALVNKFHLSFFYGIYFIFSAMLLAVIVIDFEHQIIPDLISIPGMAMGFIFSFLNPSLTWQASLLGILTGGGLLYAVAAGYYLLTKREGMGGGDIKLLAMIGAFLGWQSIFFVVFSSALLGSLVGAGMMIKQRKGGKTVIPFGPFLSLSAWVYMFWGGEKILSHYLQLVKALS